MEFNRPCEFALHVLGKDINVAPVIVSWLPEQDTDTVNAGVVHPRGVCFYRSHKAVVELDGRGFGLEVVDAGKPLTFEDLWAPLGRETHVSQHLPEDRLYLLSSHEIGFEDFHRTHSTISGSLGQGLLEVAVGDGGADVLKALLEV